MIKNNHAPLNSSKYSQIFSNSYVRSMRSEYINSAVGYVKLKRKENTCTVMAQVCPEHKVNTKNYNVLVEIEEEDEEIKNAKCQDCAASAGKCSCKMNSISFKKFE